MQTDKHECKNGERTWAITTYLSLRDVLLQIIPCVAGHTETVGDGNVSGIDRFL